EGASPFGENLDARLPTRARQHGTTGSIRTVEVFPLGSIRHGRVPPESRVKRQRRQSRIRKEPVMGGDSTVVGLDTHKAAIHVAMLLPAATEPVQWQIVNEPAAVRHLVRKL